jgi:ABC-2 type transport system permease protein
MTTATAVKGLARTPAVPPATRRPGLAETMRSEFIKIRSVRSTYWTLLAQALAAIAFAGIRCAGIVSNWPRDTGFNPADASLSGQVGLGELIIVVLGALVITSEYSTGMIRTSLTVMPRRGVLYAAKAIVFAAVSLVLSLVTSFAAFFTGQVILSEKHINTTLAQPFALRAVLLSAAVVTVFGLLAYGAGAIIRNTAGAITAILGMVFLLPLLAQTWSGGFRAARHSTRSRPAGPSPLTTCSTPGASSPSSVATQRCCSRSADGRSAAAMREAAGTKAGNLPREDARISAEIRCYAEFWAPDPCTRIPRCTDLPCYLEFHSGICG